MVGGPHDRSSGSGRMREHCDDRAGTEASWSDPDMRGNEALNVLGFLRDLDMGGKTTCRM